MITILILKNGRPLKGVRVSYAKKGFFGGIGNKITDSSGQASFDISPGRARIKLQGSGISQVLAEYYLQNGINEFRF